jgi:hypothetical protein
MMDLAVFLFTCNLGSTVIIDGDWISWHSCSVRVRAGVEYVNFGIRYNK